MARQFDKLAFVASPTPEAKDAAAALGARYAHAPPEQADVVVALGGDGLMLQRCTASWAPASRSTA